MNRRLARLVVAFALVVGAGGCRRGKSPPAPPKPLLGPIAVEDLTPPEEAPARLDLPLFEKELREHLVASGLFDVSGRDGGAGVTARIAVALATQVVEVETKGEARARVRIRVDSRPSDAPGALAFDLEGQGMERYAIDPKRPDARGDRQAMFDGLVLRVASDLVNDFAGRRRLHGGPPAAVHAALVSDAGALREEAIRVVAERKLRDEVPVLLKLLGDPEETVRDAALGALIALKERRAVTELTRTRSLRDRREMRKIIEAISILGGEEAHDYLSFVAESHDDEEIRQEAAAARARLVRRESEAGTGR